MPKTMTEVEEYYAWVKAHREELIAAANLGDADAKSVIGTYNWLVKRADVPTVGVFMGCVDGYIRNHPEPEDGDANATSRPS